MKPSFALAYTIAFICVLCLISLIPLPGVNQTHEIQVNNSNYTVSFLDQHFTDEEAGAIGTYNLLSQDIEIATENHSTLLFLSTCTHEVNHLRYSLLDRERPISESLTRSEEHKAMANTLLLWNWETECIKLLPSRIGIAS